MKREPYTYSILRYRHDPVAGELVNVGVVLHAPKSGYLAARLRSGYGRIAKMFPDLDGKSLRQDLAAIEKSFVKLAKLEANGLFFETANAATFASRVVARDDSSLIWSEMGSGLAVDPESTLDRLFVRFVSQYEEATTPKRTDADVWRPLRDKLAERAIAAIFERKTISSSRDEVEFEHAWKNGKWHCIQPLSFDLASVDGIQEKAARWVGHMVGLSKSSENFQPYFIVGAPSRPDLEHAYQRALDFIGEAPLDPQIVKEEEFDQFADHLAGQVAAHRRG